MPDSVPRALGVANHRVFSRIELELAVRYRFLPTHPAVSVPGPEMLVGTTTNLSAGGLLLVAQLPAGTSFADLLLGRLNVGVEIDLPQADGSAFTVRAICRVAWMQDVEEQSGCCNLGLAFQEITLEHRDRVVDHVIRFSI
ncbi:MAG: PilZ domain-containing protein [Planctomycetes bacterium]|nr:PilZ domain-containing protein [Planctomycetota bacterium]